MFPFRYSSIFKSRWMALLWASGICWMAYDFAGTTPDPATNNSVLTDATGIPIDPQSEENLKKALEGL
jgi:hypothetical protein